MVLPVHFELGLKYPVVVRMDAQGNFRDWRGCRNAPMRCSPLW